MSQKTSKQIDTIIPTVSVHIYMLLSCTENVKNNNKEKLKRSKDLSCS